MIKFALSIFSLRAEGISCLHEYSGLPLFFGGNTNECQIQQISVINDGGTYPERATGYCLGSINAGFAYAVS